MQRYLKIVEMARRILFLRRYLFLTARTREGYYIDCNPPQINKKPQHLICFKDWTAEMVEKIINSAIGLKKQCPDTRGIRLPTLSGAKIMILQEVNHPILHLAVSKAATFMGAQDVSITDKVIWEHNYMGRIFSEMADVIFVSTSTHNCIYRFAEHSLSPVLCMQSRTHAAIQALAAVMCIVEEFQNMKDVNVGYLGPPHPILNSLLLLCPMLGANIKFKCSCDKNQLTPLLFKLSETMCDKGQTTMKRCAKKEDIFDKVNVIVAGPTTTKKSKLQHFCMDADLINKGNACSNWIFLHVCPRGAEVPDSLFCHSRSRTYNMFCNMQYIAAALMTHASIGYLFDQHEIN